METNIDFKQIWNAQKVETPNIEALYTKANKLKSRRFLNLIILNITLLLTIIFIGFIWYYYQPKLITTKLGIVLTILAIIIFLSSFNKQFSLLSSSQTEPSSKTYILQLTKLKESQVFLQTIMISVYFVMLTLGIGLYLFEFVSQMTTAWGIFTYGITMVWFALNWFYIRPKVITKQNAKINSIIAEFEKLKNQLKD